MTPTKGRQKHSGRILSAAAGCMAVPVPEGTTWAAGSETVIEAMQSARQFQLPQDQMAVGDWL